MSLFIHGKIARPSVGLYYETEVVMIQAGHSAAEYVFLRLSSHHSVGCIRFTLVYSFRCKTTTLIFLSFTFCHRLLSGCLAALKTNLNSLIVIGEKNHISSNNFINEWHCMQLWKMKPVMSVILIFDNILIILRRRLLWVQKKLRFYNSLWEEVHAERETGNVIENLTHTHCHILFCKFSHLQPHMFTFIN